MVKYRIREDGVSRIPATQEYMEKGSFTGEELLQILAQEYPYLYESFKGYRGLDLVGDKKYSFLKEVLYDNKVVGFAIYSTENLNDGVKFIELDLIYILPEYRGKGAMYDELRDIAQLYNNKCILTIDCPNYHIVKSLLKNKHAMKLDENIVYLGQVPISMRTEKNVVVICNYYDLRLKRGFNTDLKLLTPLLDRDIIDGFCNIGDAFRFFGEYNSPLDYFEEVKQVIEDYGKN